VDGLGVVGQHPRVQRVGLGELADGQGEVADAARLDDAGRQAGLAQGDGQRPLQAGGRLQDDQPRRVGPEPIDQGGDALRRVRVAGEVAAGARRDIEPILRDVDAEESGCV
jgi:hypothetical protein